MESDPLPPISKDQVGRRLCSHLRQALLRHVLSLSLPHRRVVWKKQEEREWAEGEWKGEGGRRRG